MQFVGIKIVNAIPMAVAEPKQYSAMDGQAVGAEGYEVTYENNYKSWCPKAEFEKHNQPFDKMSFGRAIELCNSGRNIARRMWNGTTMHVKLGTAKPTPPPLSEIGDGSFTEYPAEVVDMSDKAFYVLVTEEGEEVQNWGPAHNEMQADDWFVVEESDDDDGEEGMVV